MGRAAVSSKLSFIAAQIAHPLRALATLRLFHDSRGAECSCCGYKGPFLRFGTRPGAKCPKCDSGERHRLFALAAREEFLSFSGRSVLHFAPEPCISATVKGQRPRDYRTADIRQGKADMVLDLEAIDLPGASVETVIASHVLEHVDDRKALSEIHRILTPGGQLVAMVPIVEGWAETYEDPAITSPADRAAHFGQFDHVRYYGADFRHRLAQAGFSVTERTAGGAENVRYRLGRGSKIFLGTKP